MKYLCLVLLLVGRLLAVQCAERNIYLSNTASTVSISGLGCTAVTVGGITYSCGSGAIALWGFDIESSCDTQYINYVVSTVDTANGVGHKYDIGLVYVKGPSAGALAGHLMTHTGALAGQSSPFVAATSFTPATGLLASAKAWITTADCPSYPCTLPAGQYALALATDCTTGCAGLQSDDNKGWEYLTYVWEGGQGGTGLNSPPLVWNTCTSTCSFNMATLPGLPVLFTPPVTDPGLWHSGFTRPPMVLIF